MQSHAESALSDAIFHSSHYPASKNREFVARAISSSAHGPLPTYACTSPPVSKHCTMSASALPMIDADDENETNEIDLENDPDSGNDEQRKYENAFATFVFVVSIDAQIDGKFLSVDGSIIDEGSPDTKPLENYFERLVTDLTASHRSEHVDMRRRMQRFSFDHRRLCLSFFGTGGRFHALHDVLNQAAAVKFATPKPEFVAHLNHLLPAGPDDEPKLVCAVCYQSTLKENKPRVFLIRESEREMVNAAFVLINFRFVVKMHVMLEIDRMIASEKNSVSVYEAAEKLGDHEKFYAQLDCLYVEAKEVMMAATSN